MFKTKKYTANGGFTIVEMSIVVLIIGLLVGGILVGQDLIRGAKIRGQITQIQKLDSAVATFADKFKALPGDYDRGAIWGTPAVSGNANNVIGCSAVSAIHAPTACSYDGEYNQFFIHLSLSDLTEGTYVVSTARNVGYPAGEIDTVGIIAFTEDTSPNRASHWWLLGAGGSISGTIDAGTIPVLTPAQAFGIDNKMDDGVPDEGTVLANSDLTCVNATGIYDLTLGEGVGCFIQKKMITN